MNINSTITLIALAFGTSLAFAEPTKNPWVDPNPTPKDQLHYEVDAQYKPGGSWQGGVLNTSKSGAMSVARYECSSTPQPWNGDAYAVRITDKNTGAQREIRCGDL